MQKNYAPGQKIKQNFTLDELNEVIVYFSKIDNTVFVTKWDIEQLRRNFGLTGFKYQTDYNIEDFSSLQEFYIKSFLRDCKKLAMSMDINQNLFYLKDEDEYIKTLAFNNIKTQKTKTDLSTPYQQVY
jgi:hypothetical protein